MIVIRKKLIQTNIDGSYLLVLPLWWIENNQLKKGDLLNLDIENDKITVTKCVEEVIK